MSNEQPRQLIPTDGGFLHDLIQRVKLIARLIGDPRINPWLKLLPLGSVIYLFFPDLAPGPIDDAAVLWIGTYLFVELCPPHIVQEHLEELRGEVIAGSWRETDDAQGEILDAEDRDTAS